MYYFYFWWVGFAVCALLFYGVIWRSGKSMATRLLLAVALTLIPALLRLSSYVHVKYNFPTESYDRSLPEALRECLADERIPAANLSAALRSGEPYLSMRLWRLKSGAVAGK